MGVLAHSSVKGSLWYKGDIVKFSINGLNGDGEWTNIVSGAGVHSDEWKQITVSADIPASIRAIMIEITLNQAQGMPLPVVLIDDVKMDVRKR